MQSELKNALITSSYYLKNEHALLVHCSMSDFLIDFYVEREKANFKDSPKRTRELIKLLAASALHITVRSPEESVAWTVLMQDSNPYSIFVTTNPSENVLIGQVLTENIRHTDINIFHSQLRGKKGKITNSSISCEEPSIEKMFESYYEKSEQLPLKASLLRDTDDATILVGMPEIDLKWFEQNEPDDIFKNLQSYNPQLMKQSGFDFKCNCSPEKLLPYLKTIPENELAELYGNDKELIVNCPRCGKNFPLDRSLLFDK